ncbi:MAG: hypothetical protein NW224_25820 [Leptolyngbyaceae cyanobacterium bins.302]|nr:hypothetical protein [Leptolyngbyaceae cyanobacterium bins.302]
MTDPGSVQRSWLVEDSMASEWADPLDDVVAKSLVTQLKLDLDIAPPGIEGLQAEPEPELDFLRKRLQKQSDRIQNLERALDQSLTSLEELRVQLVDQHFLENQLAATEEIANIQQRAITQLKQQLAQQQCALESQQSQTQHQTETFQALLNVIEGLAEGQQSRLAQLKVQFQHDRLLPELQIQEVLLEQRLGHSTDAPDPQLGEVADLTRQISNLQHIVEQLETELDRAHVQLQEQQALIDSLQRESNSQPRSSDSPLDQELFAAYCKIQDLETQISKQITTQAILQHTCQELEQARDRYQTRASELEFQTADMQEEILKQAQQASEYETAIQHWKDRYVKSQDYLMRLRDLVERSELHPSHELAELLAAIQVMTDISEPESTSKLANRISKMDIPDFLARHQRYRVRP